jgi:hypothetical protein
MRRILAIALLVAGCGGTVASPQPIASPTSGAAVGTVAPTLAATQSTEPIPAPNGAVPEVESVGFGTSYGTGDSRCVLGGRASTFSSGSTVVMAASFSPVPSSVTITTTKDGVLAEDPETITPDALGCINGSLSGLDAGHYKIVLTVAGSQMPPLTGEFDVTP